MERDRGATAVQGAESRKGRIMGKLFGGRERKVSNEQRGASGGDEIHAFLTASPAAPTSPTASRFPTTAARSSFDGFLVTHPAPTPPSQPSQPSQPPQLAKLDTRSVSRYPNNSVPLSAGSQSSPLTRFPPKPPRPGARGLHVRFANSYPEIIGEGGDESEIPVVECGRRRHGVRSSPNPQAPPSQGIATPERNYVLPHRSPGSPFMPFSGQQSAQHHQAHQQPHHQLQQQLQQQYQPQQHQQQQTPPQQQYQSQQAQTHRATESTDDFVPAPIRRTQTGYTAIPESSRTPRTPSAPRLGPPNQVISDRTVAANNNVNKMPSSQLAPATNDQRRSFIEIQQAEMRQAEGRALANALRKGTVSPPSSPEPDEIDDSVPVSPISASPVKTTPPPIPQPRHPRHVVPATMLAQNSSAHPESSPVIPPPAAASTPDGAHWSRPRQVAQSSQSPPLATSPSAAVHRAFTALRQNTTRQSPMRGHEDGDVSPVSTRSGDSTSPRPTTTTTTTTTLHDVVQSASDDTLTTFVNRSRHLFELFRLQAETVRPLSTCNAMDIARASLWWFLIGRMTLESSFRERSSQGSGSPMSRAYEAAMMQAYADLAKSYWLAGVILLDHPSSAQTEQARSSLLYSLRKLSVSMARNNIMPPEDVYLPQTIDKTIWIKYPPISSDVVALLWGNWASSLTMASNMTPPMSIIECLPLSDSSEDFVFSRMKADVYLMEEARDSSHPQQQFHLPCMLSVARPCTSSLLEIVVASQSDLVQLRVRGKTNANGPSWDDIRWRPDMHSLELRLPRGLILAIQLTKPDFGLLWSMYDFGNKIQNLMYPRRDEQPAFQTTLKAFQYFETGAQTGSFPKEAVPNCDVALFETVLQENAATGRRHFHRGFRIAVVSGTRTRTLYGITQTYLPEAPVQFDFLRGEAGEPALFLRFENARSKGNMVLSFAHSEERTRFLSLLADTVVHNTERTPADVPIMSLDVCLTTGAAATSPGGNHALATFKKLPVKRLFVVNLDDEPDETTAPTVLSEHLKMVLEAGNSTVVDRINVAPGELRIRLDVRCNTSLTILRQPQKDLTVAIPDMQVAREIGHDLASALRVISTAPTCRMLRFNTLADLHAVQQAITGYRVLFDGVALSVLIARRRLVVPIHKKWETGPTRIQIVSHMDTKVVQLLAFFQDWHYGQCMSFVLKGTDVYEAFGRGSKTGIKFDDAKFPLPRVAAHDGGGGSSSGGSSGGGGGGGGGSGGGGGQDLLKSRNNGSAVSVTSSTGTNTSLSSASVNNNNSSSSNNNNSGDGSGGSSGSSGSAGISETAFVCLDMPDLPGEHDDISIMFDKESERDRLAACLPAPVRGSRLAKMFKERRDDGAEK